jgi:molecular chaperone DnaK
MFTTAVNQQRAMKIKVLQGERELAADNWTLGEFELEFSPARKGAARVGVQFEIDANGILHVLARDTQTGVEKIVDLTSAVDVSDEAVEAMISDSLEHAFEDMSERIWTETRLKAEEMLAAVAKALPLAGDRFSKRARDHIEEMAQNVRSAMQTHQTPRLQAANAALDAGTQELAAFIVERAMSANAQKTEEH